MHAPQWGGRAEDLTPPLPLWRGNPIQAISPEKRENMVRKLRVNEKRRAKKNPKRREKSSSKLTETEHLYGEVY